MNMLKYINSHYVLAPVLFFGVAAHMVPVRADNSAEAGVAPVQVENAVGSGAEATGKVYVMVNDTPIMVREYNQRLVYTLKNKYYHGRVPEGKEEETRKELTDEMVNHILLLEDAKKRGFKPDDQRVEAAVASEARKNRNNPDWLRESERLQAQLRVLAAEKSLLDQLTVAVKNVPQPTTAEVRAYYETHLDLFTEPEKLRLSVILFKVEPAATDEVWRKTYDQAQKISDQIKEGADFAKMAMKYSGDKSAMSGGDMGYLHRGMVPAAIQDGIDKFVVGQVSAPYKGLEGLSVFRLEDRIPPKKMEFQQVEQRAGELLMRDRKDRAWKENLERLRGAAKIVVVTPPVALPGGSN